jgi:hypothetical protein
MAGAFIFARFFCAFRIKATAAGLASALAFMMSLALIRARFFRTLCIKALSAFRASAIAFVWLFRIKPLARAKRQHCGQRQNQK